MHKGKVNVCMNGLSVKAAAEDSNRCTLCSAQAHKQAAQGVAASPRRQALKAGCATWVV
jgi:hypothetical protein